MTFGLSRRVGVVNETMVKRWFGSKNPLGRTFQTIGPGDTLYPPVEIVGVVRDTKYQRIDETTSPSRIVPPGLERSAELLYAARASHRGSAGGDRARRARRCAADVNPQISLGFMTLEAQVDASLARPRLLATLSGFMGALALVLAVIGLYGMMSYDVERRRNEIGIRKALGAPTPQLWRMVAGEASRLIGAGVVIGAADRAREHAAHERVPLRAHGAPIRQPSSSPPCCSRHWVCSPRASPLGAPRGWTRWRR